MTGPKFSPVGDGYLWSCDMCGTTVASGNRHLHIEWHTRILLAPASTSICYCPDRGDNYHSAGAPGCTVTSPESGEPA